MNRLALRPYIRPVGINVQAADTASAYNQAVQTYAAYADGSPEDLFSFAGHHAYADRCVWSVLDAKLHALRDTGATSVSILDAGCGPGMWTRRLVTRASDLGFSSITARGFDVAQVQIRLARRNAKDLKRIPGVNLNFDVADLEEPMPEWDASVDITVCLYSVLSHLPPASMPRTVMELARVTRGSFITTVRAVGSMPTVCVDSVNAARDFRLDHDLDRCDIEFHDGRRLALPFHLFTPDELRGCFAERFDIEDLCGLDLFHGRFSPDARWNPASHGFDLRLSEVLGELERKYARDQSMIEWANHLLLVARPRNG